MKCWVEQLGKSLARSYPRLDLESKARLHSNLGHTRTVTDSSWRRLSQLRRHAKQTECNGGARLSPRSLMDSRKLRHNTACCYVNTPESKKACTVRIDYASSGGGGEIAEQNTSPERTGVLMRLPLPNAVSSSWKTTAIEGTGVTAEHRVFSMLSSVLGSGPKNVLARVCVRGGWTGVHNVHGRNIWMCLRMF